MEEALIGILGAVAGVLAQGVVDFFRFKQRAARKDHEHRQAYYHDLLTSEDRLRDLAFHTDPMEAAGVLQVVEATFKNSVNGLRAFGSIRARRAARSLDEAWETGDEGCGHGT